MILSKRSQVKDPQGMTGRREGVAMPSLGLYLLVLRSGNTVMGVSFSRDMPEVESEIAEMIVAHIEEGAPLPEVELDMSGCTEFQTLIYGIVRAIPRGSTMSYGEVAAIAGRPKAARAVGRAIASNPFALIVPCHRVVGKAGPGGYLWGRELKERLLVTEGAWRCAAHQRPQTAIANE